MGRPVARSRASVGQFTVAGNTAHNKEIRSTGGGTLVCFAASSVWRLESKRTVLAAGHGVHDGRHRVREHVCSTKQGSNDRETNGLRSAS
jgi:hypothetical protein